MRLVSLVGACSLAGCVAQTAAAQTALTWVEVRAHFEANNPNLQAGVIGIDESKAEEVTAFLRPNPSLSLSADVINLFQKPAGSGRFTNMLNVASLSYLLEMGHKRDLRRLSAEEATGVALSAQADLDRTLTYALRGAFVQLLQGKAFLTLAKDELSDYDKVLKVSRERLKAGDIARIDLDRLELQRVQYESDLQTATVNVRTAKIQLIQLMNEHAPVDAFDVTGPYDFVKPEQTLEELRKLAFDRRPDLKAALQSIEMAKTNYHLAEANGTTDPTIGADFGWPQQPADYSPPVKTYVGVSVSVPLRVFDRNQGEKTRTRLDVDRNSRLADAAKAQVVSDVDSAYATVMSTVALLEPYKASYLAQATRVRDTMTFSYERGGASLLDFLQAQQDYRSVQIAYVNLIAAFLNSVGQLNLAVGEEVIL